MKSKDYLFLGLFLGLAFLMLMIIYLDEPIKDRVIISAHTQYIYTYETDGDLSLMFYVNDEMSPYLTKANYERLVIKDENALIQMDVELSDLKINHEETYLNQTYRQITLDIKMPYLTADLMMSDLYLDITLTNGKEISIPMGSLYLGVFNQVRTDALNWTGLYGFKSEDKATPRIKSVHIPYTALEKSIDAIKIGDMTDISFKIEENEVIIEIPDKDALLYAFPIKIIYSDQSTDLIPHFLYMKNYQILVESGPLLYVTAID